MINERNRIIFQKLVQLERERQNKKFPDESKQKAVTLPQWGCILGEEYGEFLTEINDHDDLKAIIELAETAAVCQRIAEVYFPEDKLLNAHQIMNERTAKQQPKDAPLQRTFEAGSGAWITAHGED